MTIKRNEATRTRRLAYFLVLSLVGNVGLLAWERAFPQVAPALALTAHESHHVTDTDGDGVPDHRDSCPESKRGWLSGRATDFDADGCADATEDKDRDNDGIPDIFDRCPATPQKYKFGSNAARDFDRDGCADGVEDSDDDNDSIPNSRDACSQTVRGEASDSEGCSVLQREVRAKIVAQGGVVQGAPGAQAESEEEESKFEQWQNTIISCGLQVVLGAILSEFYDRGENYYSDVKEQHGCPVEHIQRVSSQMISVPTESIKRFSSDVNTVHEESIKPVLKQHGIRILCYLCVLYFIRSRRCDFASYNSWLGIGVRAISGSCPEKILE